MPFSVDESFVRNAEETLGAKLPDSFRRAMIAANGGEVITEEETWFLYPILDSSDRKRLSRTCNDIISGTRSCEAWGRFPAHAIAIANNGAGDQLVFLRSLDRFGPEVYFWSHETGALTKIAEDFAELERS